MSDAIDDFMAEVAANQPTTKFIFEDEGDLVAAMNDEVQMISLPDGTKFVRRNPDGSIRLIGRRDAETELAQYQLATEVKRKDGATKLEMRPGFNIWLKSPDRHRYMGQIFKPWTGSNEEPDPLYLNMWTGYAVEPKEGDWSLMRAHVRENICNGNEEHFRYLMAWMAQLFQHPGDKIGVAVVLRGKKGVGKSILSKWIRHIIGARHAMVVDKKEQWTGRFTSQLALCVFLGCEEGLFAGSHEQDSSIKHLISSEDFAYEAKGKDIVSGSNYTRVLVTSNEDWAVPATPGERRFFVSDVATTHMQDTPYFDAITAQMEAGGAAAMLYELLKHDYAGIDLRNPPKTQALNDQIDIGLPANLAWLVSALSQGEFTFLDRNRAPVHWPDRKVVAEDGKEPTEAELKEDQLRQYVLKSDVQDSYRDFVPSRRDRPVTDSAIGKFLTKQVPGVEPVKRRIRAHPKSEGILTPHYRLPWLSDARAAFLKDHSGVTFAPPDREVEEVMSPSPEANEPEEAAERSNVVVHMQRRSRF